MRFTIMFLFVFFAHCCLAQQTIVFKILSGSKAPIPASIQIQEVDGGLVVDSSGIQQYRFNSNGVYKIQISSVGYAELNQRISIPFTSDTAVFILEADEEVLDEVLVQSTRTSRTIANVPTRVETIDLEEIDEKTNMRPANIAMLLHESTGIQVQQTSATSANASIRIQGLDGRYTQLLKDGFPNFGNFTAGLSVLEIPPLDLRQVEIIKGPASPLFGGGAIAGVVNFISKTPKDKPAYEVMLNHSSINQSNVGLFAAAKNKKVGYTLLALYNRQSPYDVDKDGFTEIPRSNELTVHPKLFVYLNDKTTIELGNSLTVAKREGGDVQVVKGTPDATHQFFEQNKTFRNLSTLTFQTVAGEHQRYIFKQSFGVFDRTIDLPGYTFSGKDYTTYSDFSYVNSTGKHSLVLGATYNYNQFREKHNSISPRDNLVKTAGLYGQHTLDITDMFKLETGIRLDRPVYSNPGFSNSEFFVLPRVSLLVTYNSSWSTRIGGGMGYKTPTLFTEETERQQFRNVDQLQNVSSEKSYGGTADVSFRTNAINNFSISFNQMFFYTSISKPLVLTPVSLNYQFVNASRPVNSSGFETNARFIYKENFKLFLGYTYTNAKARYLDANQFLPLVPKSKLNTALIYEKEKVIKIGLEGYFTGKQYLSDGTQTPSFYELGFMAEKLFDRFSVFINFENFTDTRQSRYKNMVNGSRLKPVFDEIWTHTEGFVVNGGIKLKL